MDRAVADHLSPGRRRRGNAEADEAETCLDADRIRRPEARHDDELAQEVWYDVNDGDAPAAEPHGAGSLDVWTRPDHQGRRVRQPHKGWGKHKADGEYHPEKSRPEDPEDEQTGNKVGEGQRDVDRSQDEHF